MTKRIGRLLGPLAFMFIAFIAHPQGLSAEAHMTLACAVWVAIWWITEAAPMAVTALLPILLFPLTGAVGLKETTSAYGHPFIFLFLGGFVIAKALERWDLHRRIALNIILFVGTDMRKIVFGFMLATAFLSMWISNTATSVMMLPIGLAVVSKLEDDSQVDPMVSTHFGKALMLAIAYAASIGGIATLIGTPPNLVFAGVMQETFGYVISFEKWLLVGVPFSLLMLIICWQYLTRFAFPLGKLKMPGGRAAISDQRKKLGKPGYEEKAVAVVFGVTAVAWVSKAYVLKPFLPAIDDSMIALFGAIALFLIPARSRKGAILQWEEAVNLPWGVLLLYGGGLAIAAAFKTTGLATWIGEQLTLFGGLHEFVMILLVVAAINFLTEITSNLATTAMLLPVLGALATSLGLDPLTLMVAATIAASCAFMLPVATPPNAVVFGSGRLQVSDMVRAGIWLNLLSIVLVSVVVYLLVGVLQILR
ncbi:SLC13 family permease [Marinoscillum furvescens]|uniref:Sodium-dependent dicarboxylate transporter 2/3/5 n=1 Tax=Marinoscillum furvescens DSM 4134 TaxID=1122208 RepID=A0A3D9KZB9_MARFU|nr:SLC13 family permease [Marinoscillum furvescens]RED95256.1 sodium-dependent dicarboxylate transporter 2/3/5 [Marinoscillum furvescens DSM 4134]